MKQPIKIINTASLGLFAIVVCLFVGLPMKAAAADGASQSFSNSADDIVNALNQPKKPVLGKRRSLFGGEGSARSIKIKAVPVLREGVSGEKTTATMATGGGDASTNLKIEFATNSDSISSGSKRLLGELADALARPSLRDKHVIIAGHTDATGDDNYNLELSFKRARAVRNYLVYQRHLSASRFQVVGFGEEAPIADNTTAHGRQLNRRVEIIRK